MIRLDRVSRIYNLGEHQVLALNDVSEHVAEGEHVAIMGPSGSGKSTLLNVVGCLDRPSKGRLFLAGEEASTLEDDALSRLRRRLIGFVFQSYHLIPRLDAAANVELPMVFAGVPRGERRQRVAEALAEVGLEGRTHHRPSQLSGGERQRVAIARAMILRPRILLADEPTGNLDQAAGHRVLDLLDRLNDAGITLMVVTHDPDVARRADRMLVMNDGRIAGRLEADQVAGVTALLHPAEESP